MISFTLTTASCSAFDDIDAVSVCLPTYLHHESGLAVLESGRHLLVEKPLTMTVAEGRSLAVIEAAPRSIETGQPEFPAA